MCGMYQAHTLQICHSASALRGHVLAPLHPQSEPDILQRGQPAKELWLLKNIAKPMVFRRGTLTANPHGSPLWLCETGQQIE